MKKIMGIDPSTHTGIVVLGGHGPSVAKYVNFPEEKGFDRLHLIAKAVHNTVIDCKPDIVVIEDYAVGNKFTRTEMVEVGTAIRSALYELGLGWWTIPPTSLKLWTCGKGGGKGKEGKAAMAAAVLKRWGFKSKYDDVVDAYALARFGQHIHINGIHSINAKGVIYHGHKRIQKSSDQDHSAEAD
jgi:Holliday junction resolvasome RuvABC endonuclease subunit